MNPLLQDFNTAPFSKIESQHYKPAIEKAIEMAKAEIDAIVSNPEKPTFENTTAALDFSGETLNRITSIFFNLNAAETNDEIQKIAQEISPLLSDFKNDLLLNENLFKRVKQVYDTRDSLFLNEEQKMLLEKQYKRFSRNGANLSDTGQETLREIDSQLSQLKLKFGENILAETNDYRMQITDKEKLSGLPEGSIETAAQTAKEENLDGWVFTLDYPSYVPFVTYADDRELRKKITIAFGKRAFKNNEFDNQTTILEIVNCQKCV